MSFGAVGLFYIVENNNERKTNTKIAKERKHTVDSAQKREYGIFITENESQETSQPFVEKH